MENEKKITIAVVSCVQLNSAKDINLDLMWTEGQREINFESDAANENIPTLNSHLKSITSNFIIEIWFKLCLL